jgi:hypothetical protein
VHACVCVCVYVRARACVCVLFTQGLQSFGIQIVHRSQQTPSLRPTSIPHFPLPSLTFSVPVLPCSLLSPHLFLPLSTSLPSSLSSLPFTSFSMQVCFVYACVCEAAECLAADTHTHTHTHAHTLLCLLFCRIALALSLSLARSLSRSLSLSLSTLLSLSPLTLAFALAGLFHFLSLPPSLPPSLSPFPSFSSSLYVSQVRSLHSVCVQRSHQQVQAVLLLLDLCKSALSYTHKLSIFDRESRLACGVCVLQLVLVVAALVGYYYAKDILGLPPL